MPLLTVIHHDDVTGCMCSYFIVYENVQEKLCGSSLMMAWYINWYRVIIIWFHYIYDTAYINIFREIMFLSSSDFVYIRHVHCSFQIHIGLLLFAIATKWRYNKLLNPNSSWLDNHMVCILMLLILSWIRIPEIFR